MRLIDADALEKWIADRVKNYHKSFPDWRKTHPISVETALLELDCIKDVVRESPTVDAVPVVRCEDCKSRGFDACPMCHDEYTYDEDDGGDYYTVDNTTDDGFCHMGAKMDEKEEET